MISTIQAHQIQEQDLLQAHFQLKAKATKSLRLTDGIIEATKKEIVATKRHQRLQKFDSACDVGRMAWLGFFIATLSSWWIGLLVGAFLVGAVVWAARRINRRRDQLLRDKDELLKGWQHNREMEAELFREQEDCISELWRYITPSTKA